MLDHNEFVSTIPTEIGLLTKLQHFSAENNFLAGSLPLTHMQKLPDLRFINVGRNEGLSGSLFANLTMWPKLEYVGAFHCDFTGTYCVDMLLC